MYKEKYLKYKYKYLELKNQSGSGKLGIEKIFDFDRYLKNGDKYNELIITNLSTNFLYNIRNDLQIFYIDYYEYLTNSKCYEIILPLYKSDNHYKVNYMEYYKYIKTFSSEIKLLEEKTNRETIISYIEMLLDLIKKYNFDEQIIKLLQIQIEQYNIRKIRLITDFLKKYEKSTEDIKNILDKMNNFIFLEEILFTTELGFTVKEITSFEEIKIDELILMKKKIFIEKIIHDFKDENINHKIIHIGLQFINYDEINDDYSNSFHSNSIILSKFNINGISGILGHRIEPHRHSSEYCRNSVRKEIREIFNQIDNFYYVDYYMKDHQGLQINECIDIDKDQIKESIEIEDCPLKYNVLSGLDSFCSSWSAYICSIIILNKNKNITDIAKFFTLFELEDKTFTDYNIEKFNKLKEKNDESEIIEFKEYIKSIYEKIDLFYNKGYKYIFIKNIKLFCFIMYFYKFILNSIDKDLISLYSTLFSEEDKNILNNILKIINIEEIEAKLKENKLLKINISSNILEIDKKHKCVDTLFTHDEFCLNKKICKSNPGTDYCDGFDSGEEICLEPIQKQKITKYEKEYINKTKQFLKEISI
jgi:hypothetical protein